MANQYELTIKIVGGNGEERETNIADPFAENKKADKQQQKMDRLIGATAKSVLTRSSVSIVKGYTQTLGNSSLNQKIELIENAVNFSTQTIIAGVAGGVAGIAISLASEIPSIISKAISFSNGQTWDSISMNKSLRRAGAEFNRSRQ